MFALVGSAVCGLGLGGKTFHILWGVRVEHSDISRAKGPGDISDPSAGLGAVLGMLGPR